MGFHIFKAQTIIASGFFTANTNNYVGLTVDSLGNVYIVGSSNKIHKIAANTFTVSEVANGFNIPSGIAVDSYQNLYVVSAGDSSIYKIPAGNFSSY